MNKDKGNKLPSRRTVEYRKNVDRERESYTRNRDIKEQLKYLVKQIMRLKDTANEIADAVFNSYSSTVDRAVNRGILHNNKGVRLKSRISEYRNESREPREEGSESGFSRSRDTRPRRSSGFRGPREFSNSRPVGTRTRSFDRNRSDNPRSENSRSRSDEYSSSDRSERPDRTERLERSGSFKRSEKTEKVRDQDGSDRTIRDTEVPVKPTRTRAKKVETTTLESSEAAENN